MSWLAAQIARLLRPEEREAVLGDLAEAGASGARAAGGVLGLVARRQAGLWKNWRPWAALGLAIPAAWYLGIAANAMGLDLWIVVNRGDLDPAVLAENGMSVSHSVVALIESIVWLTMWAWAVGMTLGWLARMSAWLHAGVFAAVAVFYPLLFVVRYADYGLVLNVALAVMLPAGLGMRLGCKASA